MQPPSREPPSEAAAPWYLTADQIEASPSREYFVRKYGSVERARIREQESRLTTCAFLQESGQKLRLPQLSIATAIVFYHRFYARESYEHYERFQVATTCLFLASKVEETPKKLKDVITETYKVQHSTVQPPDPDSQELWKLKEQILVCERELLRVLGFDLSVEHAYRPLLAYIKSISGTRDLAQIAWNFINDSLRTTICLQYAPRCLAAATVLMASDYLSGKLGKPCPLPNHPPGATGKWFTAFQVREETVQDIVKQIQSMYDSNKSGGGLLSANSALMAKGGSGAEGAASNGSGAAAASRTAGGGGSDASSGRSSVKREAGGSGGSGGPSSAGGGGDRGGGAVKTEAKAKSEAKEAGAEPKAKAAGEDGELEEGEVGAEPGSKRQKSDSKA